MRLVGTFLTSPDDERKGFGLTWQAHENPLTKHSLNIAMKCVLLYDGTVRDRIKHFNVCKLNTEAASSDTLRYINKLCHEEKAFTCLLAPKAQLKLSFTMFRVFMKKVPSRSDVIYDIDLFRTNFICNVDLNKPIIAALKGPQKYHRGHTQCLRLSRTSFFLLSYQITSWCLISPKSRIAKIESSFSCNKKKSSKIDSSTLINLSRADWNLLGELIWTFSRHAENVKREKLPRNFFPILSSDWLRENSGNFDDLIKFMTCSRACRADFEVLIKVFTRRLKSFSTAYWTEVLEKRARKLCHEYKFCVRHNHFDEDNSIQYITVIVNCYLWSLSSHRGRGKINKKS